MRTPELEAAPVPSQSALWDWREDDWPRLRLHEALDRACDRHGADTVGWSYVDEGMELTFGAARELARSWGASMVAAGVQPGDPVAICLGSSHMWPVLQQAISQCGAVIVSVNIRYRTHELRHVLASCAPRLVISGGDTDRLGLASLVAATVGDIGATQDHPVPPIVVLDGTVPAGCWPAEDFLRAADHDGLLRRRAATTVEDTVLIQYTSGSTSAPKGVELSHDAVLTTAFQVSRAAGFDRSDVVYSALPFYHVGGSICTGVGAYVSGARMVVPQRYDALKSVRQMIEAGCTAEQGHAAMYTMQIDAGHEAGLLGALHLSKGWAAAPPGVMRRIAEELRIEGIVPVYGMSEFGLICAGSRRAPLQDRLANMGSPPPGVEVRLRQLPGQEDVGEVEVRGRQMLSRYHRDPAATREALTRDGWLRTGDLARRATAGRLVFSGRAKDMIKPGGENVSAAEVEEFLSTHPDIVAVAVIGIPDDRLGEAVAAVIQPAFGTSLDVASVRSFCSGNIASFKTPKAVFLADELPLLGNGKVDKIAVRERWGHEKEWPG